MSHLALNAGDRTVRVTRPGVEINLGAIGKGHALDVVSANLRARKVTTALLSGGSSSVVAVGGDDQGWVVGIRHPRKRDSRVATLRFKDSALATSGAGEQYFVSENRRHGHIFDPPSGGPAPGAGCGTAGATAGALAEVLPPAVVCCG